MRQRRLLWIEIGNKKDASALQYEICMRSPKWKGFCDLIFSNGMKDFKSFCLLTFRQGLVPVCLCLDSRQIIWKLRLFNYYLIETWVRRQRKWEILQFFLHDRPLFGLIIYAHINMHDHILIGQLASFNQGKCQVMILICASDSETGARASIEIACSLLTRVKLCSPLQTR